MSEKCIVVCLLDWDSIFLKRILNKELSTTVVRSLSGKDMRYWTFGLVYNISYRALESLLLVGKGSVLLWLPRSSAFPFNPLKKTFIIVSVYFFFNIILNMSSS